MPRSFAPFVPRRPKVLILGSMPGEESLRQGRYYAHPRNQFWRLLSAVLGEPLEELSYEGRLKVLERRGVALWDVLESCAREGSLDSDIEDEVPNKIAELLRETGVRAVFLNGGKAAQAFRAFVSESLPEGVQWVKLPSSSPAAAALTFDEKLERWRALEPILRTDRPAAA